MKRILLRGLAVLMLFMTFSACSQNTKDSNNSDDNVYLDSDETISDDIAADSDIYVEMDFACDEYYGDVYDVYQEDGKVYFSIMGYKNRDKSQSVYYTFVTSSDVCFDNSNLIDNFEYMDCVRIFSFVNKSEIFDIIPAHIVLRIDRVGATFYAIVADKIGSSGNRLVLKGLDINDVNYRNYYMADIEDYTNLHNLSLDDFEVGDLVSVRFTNGMDEISPSTLERTEDIWMLVKNYTDEVFNYNDDY